MEYLNKQKDMFLDLKNSSSPCCRDSNASINIKKQGLKILSGSGTESDLKQKQGEALPLGESATLEAHPISFAVGG